MIEKKEITLAQVRTMVGQTTNVIIDLELEPNTNLVKVQLEADRRLRDGQSEYHYNADTMIVKGIYFDGTSINDVRQLELINESRKKRNLK